MAITIKLKGAYIRGVCYKPVMVSLAMPRSVLDLAAAWIPCLQVNLFTSEFIATFSASEGAKLLSITDGFHNSQGFFKGIGSVYKRFPVTKFSQRSQS